MPALQRPKENDCLFWIRNFYEYMFLVPICRPQTPNLALTGVYFCGPAQRLMENDCIFRHRNIYEYIIMPDQDEFLHFPSKRLREVNLLHTFRDIFGSSNYASATYYGAQYHIHCYTVKVILG
jgi:hypothetical protein